MSEQKALSVTGLLTDFITHASSHRAKNKRAPLIVGLSGAQGSGKSTASTRAAARLGTDGLRVLLLSLDDLYLPLAARRALAGSVHPLLLTRGVPGTHDVALGESILSSAAKGERFQMPRFSKALDDRLPDTEWLTMRGPFDVIIFEGWCVGATPEQPDALATPINKMERDEDSDGLWRTYVNQQLAGPYRRLFARLDRLIFLAAPDFSVVARWRKQQEQDLARSHGKSASAVMTDAAVERFILHYERITRHMLLAVPGHADLTIRLDENRTPVDGDRAQFGGSLGPGRGEERDRQ